MTRDEITQQIRTYICQSLLRNPDYPLQEDERLISYGLIDSFALVQLSGFLEDQFDVRIPDTELTVEVMDTLRGIVDCVIRHKDAGHIDAKQSG